MPNNDVYVGPKPAEQLVAAVRGAGGQVVDEPAEATAIIWYGGSPRQFAELTAPGARWVQLPSAGVERWIEAGAINPDRVFTSAVGCYSAAVAEHALALMLAGARRLPELARARTWTAPVSATLNGATVAVVGSGGIGAALIHLLGPFGVDVLAVTRSGRQVAGARRSYGPDALPEVLAAADYVVLGAPATPQTASMIGAAQLAVMKPSAWLVNIARGTLVDTGALVEALRAGQIGGAALDVTDPEPLPDGHPLWSQPRALITPHSANNELLQLPALAQRVRDNTERFLTGRPLVGVVDLNLGY